jgi:uncharacterized protein
MGIRYLLLAAAIWALYIMVRRLLARRGKGQSPADTAPPVTMVSCTRCGIHVPQTEALEKDGQFYCCREHMPSGEQ